jgi:hypothetical protein
MLLNALANGAAKSDSLSLGPQLTHCELLDVLQFGYGGF